MNVLIIKYRINCSMHIYRGKPRIYIPAYYISLLTSIVKPHMSSDMYYKLEPGKKKPNVEITHTCGGSLHSITMPQVKSDSSVLATLQKRTFSSSCRLVSSKLMERTNPGVLTCNTHIKSIFNSYLAGLFEGRGHISISKHGSKVSNLSLSITFNLKDLPLAERLKDVLGFG